MAEKKNYRIVQIEGKITWQVEELWEGGTVRGPYGSQEFAVNAEEKIATEKGFIKDLILEETVGEKVEPASAFEKDANGNWFCVQACSITIDNKEVVFTKGLTFTKGHPFMGVDVVEWLEKNT